MTDTEIKTLIQQVLPTILAQDPVIRDFILRTVSNYYSDRPEIDSKFDRVLAELASDRLAQTQKWQEQYQLNDRVLTELASDRLAQTQKWQEQYQLNEQVLAELARDRQEQAQKWQENKRQWEKQHQHNEQVLAELQRHNRRYDSTIGALGSRWGLYSEASFRNALKGILEDSFAVEVFNLNDFDEEGEVFGRPDQVEIDIIVKNGLVIVCEIKSSISKSDMYIFDRKVTFYQKRHQRTVNRKLVISPMVDARALPVAEALGIEVYSYAEGVTNL